MNQKYLLSKGNSEKHVNQVIKRATDVMTDCGFVWISDIRPAAVQNCLHDLREKGRSLQTCNFYLQAAKQFARWMVQDRRMIESPIRGLSRMNVRVDRRHDRRPLSEDEFGYLLEASILGKRIEGITGTERRMLYLLSSCTGLRRAELSSLTLRSLDLDGPIPAITVLAAYSKNGRDDTLPLHPAVVADLRAWLATRKLSPSQPLFHLKTEGGDLRHTAKMMQRDLAAARKKWIADAADPEEQERRRESDFLRYKNSAGLFADFHAMRHTFISNLARAEVHPKMAQTLARHSTINLTMNTYTHVNMEEKSRAVGRLHATGSATPAVDRNDGISDIHVKEVSDLGPSGVRNGVTIEAASGSQEAPSGTLAGHPTVAQDIHDVDHNSTADSKLDVVRQCVAQLGTVSEQCPEVLHPAGLEPATFGSVDRCSIQLS